MLAVGCSASESQGPAVSLGPNCIRGFGFTPEMNLPHAARPDGAIRLFFLKGTTDLLNQTRPSEYRLPSSGWRFAWRRGDSMEYKSGGDTLYLSRIGNSYWEVDGGAICA